MIEMKILLKYWWLLIGKWTMELLALSLVVHLQVSLSLKPAITGRRQANPASSNHLITHKYSEVLFSWNLQLLLQVFANLIAETKFRQLFSLHFDS